MDGGVVAIVGFFYQLLGSSADFVSAADGPFNILLLEPNGEDAILCNATSEKLIQYKYSFSSNAIAPGELASILENLESRNTNAKATWMLKTNRLLSPASSHLMYGDCPGASGLTNVNPRNVRIIQKYNARLEIKQATFTEFEQELRKHGQRYGLTEIEMAAGAKRVIGAMIELIRDCGAGAQVDRAYLDEQLVGFSNPKSLRGVDRAEEIAEYLDRIAANLDGPSLNDLIPREVLGGLFAIDEPVIVVNGPGGCGKTVSVLRAIRAHILGDKVLGMSLNSTDHETFKSVVSAWRSPRVLRPHEDFDSSFERLKVANHGVLGRFVIIALDGLDESGWHPDRIEDARTLIRRALDRDPYAKPCSGDIKVIVTCRQPAEVGDLLAGGGVGGDDRVQDQRKPHFISLYEFEKSEFQAIWSKWFNELPMPIWPNNLDSHESSIEMSPLDDEQRGATAADEQLVLALRNPSMLGCFRSLEAPDRISLLSGKASAWSALMKKHLNWFSTKVIRRQSLTKAEVTAMLCAAACASRDSFSAWYERQEFWIRPASTTTGRSENDARLLFLDAVTCGLIETPEGPYKPPLRGPVSWKWRYKFTHEYLCNLA